MARRYSGETHGPTRFERLLQSNAKLYPALKRERRRRERMRFDRLPDCLHKVFLTGPVPRSAIHAAKALTSQSTRPRSHALRYSARSSPRTTVHTLPGPTEHSAIAGKRRSRSQAGGHAQLMRLPVPSSVFRSRCRSRLLAGQHPGNRSPHLLKCLPVSARGQRISALAVGFVVRGVPCSTHHSLNQLGTRSVTQGQPWAPGS